MDRKVIFTNKNHYEENQWKVQSPQTTFLLISAAKSYALLHVPVCFLIFISKLCFESLLFFSFYLLIIYVVTGCCAILIIISAEEQHPQIFWLTMWFLWKKQSHWKVLSNDITEVWTYLCIVRNDAINLRGMPLAQKVLHISRKCFMGVCVFAVVPLLKALCKPLASSSWHKTILCIVKKQIALQMRSSLHRHAASTQCPAKIWTLLWYMNSIACF